MEQRLEKVGASGSEALRVTLVTCTDPIATINEWQSTNSIELNSLGSALPLLDLHQVRRVDFHQSVVNELRSKLLETVNELAAENTAESNDRLDRLLRKLFASIHVESMRGVILELLRVVKQPPPEMLVQVREMTDVFRSECPIAVKRRIWEVDETSFQEELAAVLEPAIVDRTALLTDLDSMKLLLGTSGAHRKRRRNDVNVEACVSMCASSRRLYDLFAKHIRVAFNRSRNVLIATFKNDVQMRIHEVNKSLIESATASESSRPGGSSGEKEKDAVSASASTAYCKFAWCLDACLRHARLDATKMRELHALLKAIAASAKQSKTGAHQLADVFASLADTHCSLVLLGTASANVLVTLRNGALPRNNDELVFPLRLVQHAISAWRAAQHGSKPHKDSRVDPQVVTAFLPALLHAAVRLQLALAFPASGPPPPDSLRKSLANEDSGSVARAAARIVQLVLRFASDPLVVSLVYGLVFHSLSRLAHSWKLTLRSVDTHKRDPLGSPTQTTAPVGASSSSAPTGATVEGGNTKQATTAAEDDESDANDPIAVGSRDDADEAFSESGGLPNTAFELLLVAMLDALARVDANRLDVADATELQPGAEEKSTALSRLDRASQQLATFAFTFEDLLLHHLVSLVINVPHAAAFADQLDKSVVSLTESDNESSSSSSKWSAIPLQLAIYNLLLARARARPTGYFVLYKFVYQLVDRAAVCRSLYDVICSQKLPVPAMLNATRKKRDDDRFSDTLRAAHSRATERFDRFVAQKEKEAAATLSVGHPRRSMVTAN